MSLVVVVALKTIKPSSLQPQTRRALQASDLPYFPYEMTEEEITVNFDFLYDLNLTFPLDRRVYAI